jgi:hypothetical protein
MTEDVTKLSINAVLNPLNAELNPICHLLALLGAHHILHVSSLMVKYKTRYSAMHIVWGREAST